MAKPYRRPGAHHTTMPSPQNRRPSPHALCAYAIVPTLYPRTDPGPVAPSVIADHSHVLATEHVVGVAQLIGGADQRHNGDGGLLVGAREFAHRVRHGDPL